MGVNEDQLVPQVLKAPQETTVKMVLQVHEVFEVCQVPLVHEALLTFPTTKSLFDKKSELFLTSSFIVLTDLRLITTLATTNTFASARTSTSMMLSLLV